MKENIYPLNWLYHLQKDLGSCCLEVTAQGAHRDPGSQLVSPRPPPPAGLLMLGAACSLQPGARHTHSLTINHTASSSSSSSFPPVLSSPNTCSFVSLHVVLTDLCAPKYHRLYRFESNTSVR